MFDITKDPRETPYTINADDTYEMRQWADAFDVSVDRLRLAMLDVGNGLDAVRKRLDKQPDARHWTRDFLNGPYRS